MQLTVHLMVSTFRQMQRIWSLAAISLSQGHFTCGGGVCAMDLRSTNWETRTERSKKKPTMFRSHSLSLSLAALTLRSRIRILLLRWNELAHFIEKGIIIMTRSITSRSIWYFFFKYLLSLSLSLLYSFLPSPWTLSSNYKRKDIALITFMRFSKIELFEQGTNF